MQLKSLTPNIGVADVAESIRFYHDHFGFAPVATVPDLAPFDWAMLERDGVLLMLQSAKSLAGELPELGDAKPGGACTLFVKMKGVDELFARVHEKVATTGPIRETFYGAREFTVRDPDGYFVTFAEFPDEE